MTKYLVMVVMAIFLIATTAAAEVPSDQETSDVMYELTTIDTADAEPADKLVVTLHDNMLNTLTSPEVSSTDCSSPVNSDEADDDSDFLTNTQANDKAELMIWQDDNATKNKRKVDTEPQTTVHRVTPTGFVIGPLTDDSEH